MKIDRSNKVKKELKLKDIKVGEVFKCVNSDTILMKVEEAYVFDGDDEKDVNAVNIETGELIEIGVGNDFEMVEYEFKVKGD